MLTLNRVIESPGIKLICCDEKILEALFEGETQLASYLGINIPGQWTEFGEPAFRWTYDRINKKPQAIQQWYCYLPVLKQENMLIGSCGYKGVPENGIVEIGYEVAKGYRGRGLATEITMALIKHASQFPEISKVQAHTLAEENLSTGVLKKCGMVKVEELEDPDDGKIWRWEISL